MTGILGVTRAVIDLTVIFVVFVLLALLVLMGAERHGPVGKGSSPRIVTRKKWWKWPLRKPFPPQ
jgi:hypothetical protein